MDEPVVKANRLAPIGVAACLFLLLVSSTTTMFVRDAWALQSFQIGIFALLAAYLVAGIGRKQDHVADGLADVLVAEPVDEDGMPDLVVGRSLAEADEQKLDTARIQKTMCSRWEQCSREPTG